MKKVTIAFGIILIIIMFFSTSFAARRALLIGICDYKALPAFSKEGMCDLKGPLNDVEIIKKGLFSYYRLTNNDLRILTDHQATRNNIEASFNEWLVNGTKTGDLVFLYFSGHGSSVLDHNGDEKDGFDEVLCPYDMEPKGGANIILDDEFALWLNKLRGRRVVIIFDSCHSGGAVRSIGKRVVSHLENTPARRSRFIPITNYRPSPIARAGSRGTDTPQSVIFMAASRENEPALEIKLPDGFYGGFSFGIYDGMKTSPKFSYEKLFEHAKKVVKDRLKLAQDPQIIAQRDIVVESAFKDKQPVSSPDERLSQESIQPEQATSQSIGKPIKESSQPISTSQEESIQFLTKLEQVSNQPISPPEITGEKILLALDPFHGATFEEMRSVREGLSRLPIVNMVESEAFFDCLVRGKKQKGRYHIRLLNSIGDIVKIRPVSTTNKLVEVLDTHLEYTYMVKQLARIHHPNPPFVVKVWVTDDSRRDFELGEKIVFGVKAEMDCYILLINLDTEGNFHIIFPNRYHQNNFIRANTTVLIPDEAMKTKEFELQFSLPAGEETVKVIATTAAIDLRHLGLNEFRKTFQTVSGESRGIFVEALVNNLSSNTFAWSEDTVVIRTHEVSKP